MKKSKDKYIQKRVKKAKYIALIYNLFKIFPIKKNKIVFTAFEGIGGYACNPRYIAQELLKNKDKYKIIWLVNDYNKQFPEGIKKVKNTFLNRVYNLATAKVWIDNSRKEYGTKKRTGQYYIQTWHGEWAFKPVGKLRGNLFPKIAEIVSEYDSNMIDYVLAASDEGIKDFPKMLLYDRKISKIGQPRLDVLVNERENKKKQIRRELCIPVSSKIAIYAPTFRGGGQSGKREIQTQMPTLDYGILKRSLEEKFGGEWYIVLRLHPQLACKLDGMPMGKGENIVDASKFDDMNELIAASDTFITDYSSAAFEAMFIEIPVFIYADDIDEYIKDRGEFVRDVRKMLFPFSKSNQELKSNIINFDSDKYKKEVRNTISDYSLLMDGNASFRAKELVDKCISSKVE